ncbi:cell division protein FtsA [Candidatus Nomurabacteria bacterium]|nr:cell division protein FtsA [Candidatus Nomurabacteria bacterium]
MKRKISCGIDVGTNAVRVVVLAYEKNSETPILIGRGFAPSNGMRLGYIINPSLIKESIKVAISQAESTSGIQIKKVYLSIGGIGLSSILGTGSAIISRADNEITNLDLQNSLSEAEENLNLINKKIIQTIPLQYKLDGKEIHGRPEGMRGVKLETKALFISITKQHIEDLVTAIAECGIEVKNVVAGPIAESIMLLSEKQKMAGCALLNIGSETTTLAIYEDGLLISLQSFHIGGMDITKDIALGFKISLDDAENIKNGAIIGDYPKKRLDEIIDARLGDIFELVENHLKKIKRSGLLPAGVIISGGGSKINSIEQVGKQYLRLPISFGHQNDIINSKFKIKDNFWYTALGLALMKNVNSIEKDLSGSLNENIKDVKGFFKGILSQLLP